MPCVQASVWLQRNLPDAHQFICEGDNFDLTTSHVLPALIRKFHDAKENGGKEVVVRGTGTPRREFLHIDDLADAAVFLMQHDSAEDIVNVGAGEEPTIRELAELTAAAGY